MVRFNGGAWSVHAYGLNDVGVNGSLPKEVNSLNALRLAVKNLNKGSPDCLALGLRILLPPQGFVELCTGIYPDHIEAKVLVLS